jgi:hypothetical protein
VTDERPDDIELFRVATILRLLDPNGQRFARIVRETYDQLYDGQRTSRYRWDQLAKTEKTHMGSLIEINLQREFSFDDGNKMDFAIGGVDVDCKWTMTDGKWMIPREAMGHVLLVVTGTDQKSNWSAGVVRVDGERALKPTVNQDLKSNLTEKKLDEIIWLWRHAPMAENVLLHMDPADVAAILAQSSGQQRVNELFRRASNRAIPGGVIATVANQKDFMKRVRANGGARTTLQREGYIVLGQYRAHVQIAKTLGLPSIGPGESMASRLVMAAGPGPGLVEIDGRWWRLCRPDEKATCPAPSVPEPRDR